MTGEALQVKASVSAAMAATHPEGVNRNVA